MATYAIGDIQGCFEGFMALLDKIAFNPKHDQLWLAGDMVNRGPDSLNTLRFIFSLGDSAKTVLGNHDLHLLAHAHGVRDLNPGDTLQAIMQAPDKNELLFWLQQQPLIHHDKKHNAVMVHAGIPPIWSIKKAKKRAQEVENVLRDKTLAPNYFFNMYGNTPAKWDKTLKGTDRLRIITNYFTRMRFCSEQGKLELKTKNTPTQSPEGYKPWFHYSHKDWDETKIFFGHWAALEGKTTNPNCIALDTGYIWGGAMTAYCLETSKVTQVHANKTHH